MERTLLILAVIKYVAALVGLALTVYALGSESMRQKKLTLHKAAIPFFITIAFVSLISIVEWVLLIWVY